MNDAGGSSSETGWNPDADGDGLFDRPPCAENRAAWVSVDGDCSGNEPCYQVIQNAVDDAESGTTIFVLPGTYVPAEGVHVVDATSKLVCLRSVAGPEMTILDGGGVGTVVIAGYEGALWIEGFTITGGGSAASDVLDGYGIAIGGWDELRGWVVGNILEGNQAGRGALTFTTSTRGNVLDILVAANVVRFNRSSMPDGVVQLDLGGATEDWGIVRVENNLITDNTGWGLAFTQYLEATGNTTEELHIEVVNNTITRNEIGLIVPVEHVVVDNNIVADNDQDVFRLQDVMFATIRTNLFGNAPELVGGPGNISGDPAFVDPNAGDFELQAGSPARNVGTSELAPSTDVLGRSRDPTHPHLGAFETP